MYKLRKKMNSSNILGLISILLALTAVLVIILRLKKFTNINQLTIILF